MSLRQGQPCGFPTSIQQVQLSATDPREVLHGIADPRAWNSGKDTVLSSLYLAWEIHIFLQWLSWYVLVNHSVCPRTHLSFYPADRFEFPSCVCSPETSLDKELKLCCRVVAHILYNQVIIEDQGPWEPVTRTGHAKWGNTATDHWWVARSKIRISISLILGDCIRSQCLYNITV